MDGGGSQQPSYNMGGSSSGGGWPPSSMGQGMQGQSAQYNPFQIQPYTPQNQQSWQSMSPSFNAFSQLASQGQQTPLTNQQGINTAMQQQAALNIAQPTSASNQQQAILPPVQPTSAPASNFSLSDVNQAVGLPTSWQDLAAQTPQPGTLNSAPSVASPAAANAITPPVQNFTLADANQTAGLPAAGQPLPVTAAPGVGMALPPAPPPISASVPPPGYNDANGSYIQVQVPGSRGTNSVWQPGRAVPTGLSQGDWLTATGNTIMDAPTQEKYNTYLRGGAA